MRSRSPLALAGALIILLLAVVGFAAFSTTPVETSQTTDGVVLPPTVSGRIAGAVVASELAPGAATIADADADDVATPSPLSVEDTAATTTTLASTTTSEAPTTTTTTTEAPAETAAAPTTTAPPTTTTTTTTAAPPPSTTTTNAPPPEDPPADPLPEGAEQWRSLVEAYWPAEIVDDALSVLWCESRGDPDAVNPASGASGLFQFLPSTWGSASVSAGWAGADVFDPEANIAVAAWLYAAYDEPWQQWNCQP